MSLKKGTRRRRIRVVPYADIGQYEAYQATIITYIFMAVHAERLHTHDTGLVIPLDEIADVLELRLLRIVVGVGRHVLKY